MKNNRLIKALAALILSLLFSLPISMNKALAIPVIGDETDEYITAESIVGDLNTFLNSLNDIDGMAYTIGSNGTGVKELQRLLIHWEYLPTGEDDGKYGNRTSAAVQNFQKDAGLSVTGVADLATQFMLVYMGDGFQKLDTCYRAQVEKFAVAIWPDNTFYIGTVNVSDNFEEGTYYYGSDNYYVGQFRYNKRNGNGKAHFANGDVYIGEWKSDMMHGTGVYYFGGEGSNEYYEGSMDSNMMHGNGTYHIGSKKITGTWSYNQHYSW